MSSATVGETTSTTVSATAGETAAEAPQTTTSVLVCLPFAGAGAAFFRKWDTLVPDGLTLLPVQLPGREERFVEAPPASVEEAVAEALPWVLSQLAELGETGGFGEPGASVGRVALFGHSLGAELAFELCRLLTAAGVPVDRLLVSGSPGPRDRCVERVSQLDDEAFVEGLIRVSGYHHPAVDHPELLRLMMPLLRADNAMHEDYRSSYSELLTVPITSFRGHEDHLVSAAQAAEWARETTGGFRAVEVAGGHMYLTESEHAQELLRSIVTELEGNQ